jgi:hypothetical protein
MAMNPKVRSARPLPDYCLLLEFANGERRVFDVAPYLSKGVFQKLRDPASFGAVRVVGGSVEWPGAIDLSYDTVYLGSAPA